ncbi:hypothetical protein [Acinetobacter sp. PK01]|jgi:hypothetical protein|uniref:hypothetical protein n=1 Tax=Acinetobacter sp. PK01 TaxID=2930198 RepID=UPI001FB735FD|nr:hypothetical protein [Acinetobacter sp. PK01]UOG17509.1 hypothetical protein MP622_13610 [Acinetobacter sp. PK01]
MTPLYSSAAQVLNLNSQQWIQIIVYLQRKILGIAYFQLFSHYYLDSQHGLYLN